ncbi:RagB/SusD family nutrient uptake outer membrane protein [Flexithrix dorotheae]|uniref:RagB/SusD family nutrient uptake outer membrane protein n=1 Tax=Flexithrix dorotheae TaxID=70993 RepID=UPI000377D0EA|nr:RagB/SusD family nutrient uptake outer membrane protein [Flexithrix dorotheae]
MKKNLIYIFSKSIITVFLIGLLYGCIDLDEDPGKSLLSPEVLTTPEALDAALAGAYRQVQDNAKWSHFYIPGFGGDDITTHSASNKAGFRAFDQRNVTPTTERVVNHWNAMYLPMRSINNVIESRDKITGGDTELIDAKIGEAYFLRGLLYFYLTRSFGKVPLQLSSLPDPEKNVSEILEIYEQIESDFMEAERLLPMLNPASPGSANRPNKGSANAFLAKLYLYWGGWPLKDQSKFALSAAAAKKVMDNAGAHGFAMVEDMNTLWSEKDENRFNSEGVFTLVMCRPCGGAFGNRTTGRLGYPGDVGGWTETFAEVKFMNDMPEGPRKEASYVTELEINGVMTQWQDFENEPRPLLKKVTGLAEEIPPTSNNSNNNINRYFMRYAEVLLTYAEASARAGDANPQAWEAFNQVRRRAAGLLPYTNTYPSDITSGDLVELAFIERKWELCGEFERWFDMTRTETVKEALSDRSQEINQILGSLETDNYFTPIPQGEIDKAPQLENSGN